MINTTASSSKFLAVELEPELVYNFEVEDAHTYFVGDDAECCVLGHNQDCARPERTWSDWLDAEKSPVSKGLGNVKSKLSQWLWKGSKRYSETGLGDFVKPTIAEQLDGIQVTLDAYGYSPAGPLADGINFVIISSEGMEKKLHGPV